MRATFSDISRLRYFSREEIPGWEYMSLRTLRLLDKMRHEDGETQGWYFKILSAFRPVEEGRASTHGYKASDGGLIAEAIDGVMLDKKTHKPLLLVRQYMIALRWPWAGIGLYPYWTLETDGVKEPYPGLHLDTRACKPTEKRPRWFRNVVGEYRPIEEFTW